MYKPRKVSLPWHLAFSILFVFPSEDFWLRFSFLLYPGSLVEFNCCVAWMSSLLVTVSSDFRVKPKQNKLMVAHRPPCLFVWLLRGKLVRGLGTNLPMNTCSWRKTWHKTKYSMYRRNRGPVTVLVFHSPSMFTQLKFQKKGSGDFSAAVGFYSCPSWSSIILNHLPKRAACAACILAQRIILLAQGKWASVSVEHCSWLLYLS